MNRALATRLCAEALGTALLIIAVVGSGIMATNLTQDVAIQLVFAMIMILRVHVSQRATINVR
ncbi:MAG: hypothetical protein ACKO97_07615, partial [Actinomycetota bacterium]